jgi:hypothetical protein
VALVEVLPLEDRVREDLADSLHEGLDEPGVGLPAQAALRVPDVEGILQQLCIVGSDVEADRQDLRGMDACPRDVECELADRDPHSAGPLVTEPEDALVVGRHDQADVLEGILPQT